MFYKIGILKISQNAQNNTCVSVSVFEACNFIKKETPVQVFSSEFCNLFSTKHLFYRAPRVATSIKIYQLKTTSN